MDNDITDNDDNDDRTDYFFQLHMRTGAVTDTANQLASTALLSIKKCLSF